MSNLFTRIFIWFILIVVFVSLLTGIQASMLTGDAAYDTVEAIFSFFPFAELTVKIINTILKFPDTLNISAGSVLMDLTKLLAMTIICPAIIGFAMRILLPLPGGNNWHQNEKHMRSITYRLQETLLYILAMPICAVITYFLLQLFYVKLALAFPLLPSFVISFLLFIIILALSLISPIFVHHFDFLFILRHRLVNDLLGNLLNILLINAFCFFIVLCMLNDRQNLMIGAFLTLYISLFGVGMMIDAVSGALT